MGGGVMRGAAKVAGVGAVAGCLRGVPAVPPVEQPIHSASWPVSSQLTSKATSDAEFKSVQRPAWEIDDWEFAGVEEGQVGEPVPRIVFSAVPNFKEAKEATMELKQALDNVYLSSHSSAGTGSSSSVATPVMETKSCLLSAQNSGVSEHALQAFRLFKESPKVQDVVASVVSDNNVWKAISENPEVKSYMQSYQTESKQLISAAESHFHESSVKFEDDSDPTSSESMDINFMNELKNLGNRVTSMVSNLQSFFLNLFGVSASENKPSEWNIVGSSVMGLAVLVAMVIIVKRV